MKHVCMTNVTVCIGKWLLCIGLGLTLPLAVSAAASSNANIAQQREVTATGTVLDSNGETVIGATIRVVGTKIATVSDMDGHFRLNAPAGATLQISSVGYDPQTVKVGDHPLRIVLVDNATMLKDVQVVAFGTQKKVTVTGAISGIQGAELLKTPTGSVTNMLSGAVPGLSSIQYSGEPGSDAATVLVRGKATWRNSAPLIQVDGVERDFNEIDPNEIENITVLKDASATAVFGVRGANGVILITTKRGREGKAKISVTTSASVVLPTNMLKLANAYEYATYYNQMLKNDASDTKVPFSAEILQKFKDHSDPIRFPDTDWINYCFKNVAFQSQHNVNISGGTERVRYFISAGAFTQDGLFKQMAIPYDFNFKYRRFNYRANLDFDMTPTTTLSVNIGGRVDTKNMPFSGEDNNQLFRHLYWSTPFSSPGIVNGKFVTTATNYDDYQLPFTGASGLGAYYGMGYRSTSTNTLNADFILNQKLDFLTKGLSFRLKGSYNSDYNMRKDRGASVATYTPVLQPDGKMEYRKNGNDSQLGYKEEFGKGRNWYVEASLNYTRTFDKHHVGGLLLYNQSKHYYPGKPFDDIPSGYVGVVGRVTYDWSNRYMVEFNAGYNGSENFAPNKRYGFFPAGSAGWLVSEEPFFKPLNKIVSHLKLRGSWGLVGNDKIGSEYRFYYTSDAYTLGGGYNFGIDEAAFKAGAYEGVKHNPEVTWETAFKQDYGIDINFLNDRLSAVFDYYRENRKNILLQNLTAPSVLGFTLPFANLGKVESWGYEISLKWQDRVNADFNYWVGTNLSYNQNKIIEMYEMPQNYDYMYQKGHRIGSRSIRQFWSFYSDDADSRYFAQYGKHIAMPSGGLLPGDCVYVDLNGDGVMDNDDQSYELGHTDDPEYTVGVNLGFQWKKLELSMQWTGAWNVSRMLDETFRQPLGDTANKGLLKYQYDNTWTPEHPYGKYPRATQAHARNNYYGSTLYEVDASYLRLKSMQLAYHFDFPFMKKIGMDQCTLALSGYNLLTFTGFEWGDPESRTSDRPSYPLTRSFSVSLKLGF